MIHDKYLQLSEHEKEFTDFILKTFIMDARDRGIPISNLDPIERLAEAMAVCIVESRKEGAH